MMTDLRKAYMGGCVLGFATMLEACLFVSAMIFLLLGPYGEHSLIAPKLLGAWFVMVVPHSVIALVRYLFK